MGNGVMGNGCNTIYNKELNEILSILEKRIDFSIENIPPEIDELLPRSICFNTRREAIEAFMKTKGIRKITPKEYYLELKNSNTNIFIWKNLDGTSIKEYLTSTTNTLDCLITDDLAVLRDQSNLCEV